MEHTPWANICALALLVILPLGLNIWINIPELLRGAPYEDWDEICSYNHTRQMSQSSFRRVPSYGALDTLEFVLARKWHQVFDGKGEVLRGPLWANGVPQSFQDYKLLLGKKTWGSYAAIDYNYARGICDRSVILTVRKIDFVVTYLLLGVMLSFIIFALGFRGITVCIPLTWFLFSYGFRWSVVRALPGAQTTVLAGSIFVLLLIALKNKCFWPLHIATALCAISTNLKVDSLMMGVPIFFAYLLVQIHTLSGFTFRKFVVRSVLAICVFVGTLVLTNIELAIRPHAVVGSQVKLLLFVGSGQGVDLFHNLELFGNFLHGNLVSVFAPELSPEGAWKWSFVLLCLVSTGLLLVLAKSPTREVRLSMMVITIVTLLLLWGIPICRAPNLYGRYFVSGLMVMLMAFGFASYFFVNSFRIERSFSVWGVLVLGTISCVASSRTLLDASEGFQRELAKNSGLDPAVSRNMATLAIWNLLKTGDYDRQVIVDQHSYSDLRFFFDRHVPVVMINAWNFQDVLDEFKGHQKPVLGLDVPGSYNDKATPSWVGKWTPNWEEEYDKFQQTLASLPRVYNHDGNKMRLLDWSPVNADDSVFVFAFDPNR